jgi:hypothetical protein
VLAFSWINLAAAEARAQAPCPGRNERRALVEDAVFKLLRDTAHVAAFSHGSERGFAFSLLGADEGYLGFLTLAEPCRAPKLYDSSCSGDAEGFWVERDRCLRLSCEGSRVGQMDVFMVMRPHRSPSLPHAFSYPTTRPAGSVTVQPNPHLRWRVDETQPGSVIVTGEIAQNLEFASSAGGSLEFRLSGSTVGSVRGSAVTLKVDLLFSSSEAGQEPLVAHVAVGSDHAAAGALTLGPQVVATIAGQFFADLAPSFAWTGGCP